jgi:hypothetical protein
VEFNSYELPIYWKIRAAVICQKIFEKREDIKGKNVKRRRKKKERGKIKDKW